MATRKGLPADLVEIARKRELSRRLRIIMEERGLGVAEVAKMVEKELPGERFNPVNLSHYRAGRSLPRPKYLNALSRALGISADDLIPQNESLDVTEQDLGNGSKDDVPAFRVDDLSEGLAWLQINQRLPWPLVLKILEALKGDKSTVEKPKPPRDD